MIFYVLILTIAFLYASVGHGGASGYLALMSIYGIPVAQTKTSALILNMLVSITSFGFYYKAGFFNLRLFATFAATSIPFAFIGGYLEVNPTLYKQLLGGILLFPIARLLGIFPDNSNEKKETHVPLALLLGAIIGLLSGMLGIGGGIILTPLLLVLGWSNMKEAAAVSAIFIFVNSVSGFVGVLSKGASFLPDMWYVVGSAFFGGLLGAYCGTFQFNNYWLKKILAFVLIIAVYKLIFA